MKACPVCGSCAVKQNDLGGDSCERCGEASSKAFPHLYKQSYVPTMGVNLGSGAVWIQPKRVGHGGA